MRRALSVLTIVLAGAAAVVVGACLPSLQFESAAEGGIEGGADVLRETAPPTDGGSDHTIGDSSPEGGDARPDGPPSEASTGFGVLANAQYFDFETAAICAVRSGTLYCWGDVGTNATGQLGFPDLNQGGDAGILHPTAVPTTVQPASQITRLVMSNSHTCALYGTTPYCWGNNGQGELGNPSAEAGGPTEVPVVGMPAAGLVSIASTIGTTCGVGPVLDAGDVSNVYCWGDNGSGELGRPIDGNFAFTPLPLTGDVDGGPLGVVPNAIAVAGGGYHFCAITSDGAILCWGDTDYLVSGPLLGPVCNGNGDTCTPQPQPITLPAGETPKDLALGNHHSCVLTASGNVYCWGADDAAQLGAASVAGPCPWDGGTCTGVPVQVSLPPHVRLVSAGGNSTCALDSQGHAYCWGFNGDGQLGVGNSGTYTSPQELLDPVTAIPYVFDDLAVGQYSVCARQGQQLYCWGSGILGTLTDAGPPANPATPNPVVF
jgi:alpha-tubulin suppressor-like RCC1 family protein